MSTASFDLSGRVAVNTGASTGLGQYFGRALARAGADFVITSREKAALEQFAEEIRELAGRLEPRPRHEPARHLFCLPGLREPHGRGALRADHDTWIGNLGGGIRRAGTVRREPRRDPPPWAASLNARIPLELGAPPK